MALAGPLLGLGHGPLRAMLVVQARAHCVRSWHIASAVEDAARAIGVPPVGTCALKASASGLPIRPVLKHGPRSLTCVRVGEFGNSVGARKLIGGSPFFCGGASSADLDLL